jgi:serine/threonine-protein kinase
MSPEQIAGKKVDGRSDIYSLGVMLFQMLTGTLPFKGDSMAGLMYKIANEEAPDIRTLRPELPERLASIVALALTKRPEVRYQTGDQMATDIKLVLSLLDSPAGSQLLSLPDTTLPDDHGFAATQTFHATEILEDVKPEPDQPQR